MMPSFHNIPKVNKCDVIYTLIIYRRIRINERIYHLLRYIYKENMSKLHSSSYLYVKKNGGELVFIDKILR